MVMVTQNAIRNVLGIIGNVISFGLFLSPSPNFWEIIKKKTVGEYSSAPYVATILNCAFWVMYGLPFVKENNFLVATINGVGLAIEIIYVIIFLVYSNIQRKKRIGIYLCIEALLVAGMLVFVLKGLHTKKLRTSVVGPVCTFFNICMYLSPLTVMRKVIQTKSVKCMPFYLSLTSFLNGCIWTAYACLGSIDPWMLVSNGLGALSGAVQLILYATYYKKQDFIEEDSRPQLELPPHNLV